MSSFEEALQNLAADVFQMTGRRGLAYGDRSAPTPQNTPGPTGGPEMRSFQPTAGASVADMVRQYVGGTTGDRIAPVAGSLVDYGPIPAQMATVVAQQPVRAGTAIADAVQDPSIGRIANAGAQTAMTFGAPAKAAGIALGGLGLSAARDIGGSVVGDAVADQESGASDVLDPDQRAEYEGALKAISRQKWKSAAERRTIEAVRDRYEAILQEAALVKLRNQGAGEAAKQASQQEEYDRSVANAEAARAKAEARDMRFGDTEFGQTYNELGGIVPIAAAYGGGALSRLGFGGGTVAKDYLAPMASGIGASFGAMNWPLFADMNAPSFNPQKEALQVYSRELPLEHPRKQEYADAAEGLPDANPVQSQAYEQFYDGLLKRLGVSVIEGTTFGKLGSATVNSIPRMVRETRANNAARSQVQKSQQLTQQPGPPPQPPGGGSGGSGPSKPQPQPQGTGQQGQQGSGLQGASGHPSQYQKRGKNGQFKKGFSFKPRGIPQSNQPPSSIAGMGQNAIRNRNTTP